MEKNINYIVSGLERSGTSLVMQILKEGGFPIIYDDERMPDKNNPRGYYELYGGKIISKILKKQFNPSLYYDSAIKITCYGLPLLPNGNYHILYIERDIDEVCNSQDRIVGNLGVNIDRKRLRELLFKMNEDVKYKIEKRGDMKVLYIKHNNFFTYPRTEIEKISDFLGGIDIDKAINAIDKDLYRNKNERNKSD